MKFYSVFIALTTIFSCNSLKKTQEKPTCPEGYTCYGEVVKNKSISILRDSIGKDYIKLEESDEFDVVMYNYIYKGKPELADDGYKEIIYFEVPKDKKSLDIKDKELFSKKAIIQKSCFCRDAGFESISDGHLVVQKTKKSFFVDFNFKTSKNHKLNVVSTKIDF